MSRNPGNRVSHQGLRRRSVGVNPNKNSSVEDQQVIEEEVILESSSEDTMDGIAGVEFGLSESSSGNQSDDDRASDDEPRCDEALLKSKIDLRFEDEYSSEDEHRVEVKQRVIDKHTVENEKGVVDEQRVIERGVANNETEEVEREDEQIKDDKQDDEDILGNDEQQKGDDSLRNADIQTLDKEDKEDGVRQTLDKEDGDGGMSDEEDESRIPLQTHTSGRISPVDSDTEVECVYLPMRMVVAAGHLREQAGQLREHLGETAGHLREHIGEQAGHLRDQLGEQAGHIREQLGEQAGQIVQFGGQIREQVGEQAQKVVVQAERVVHKVKDVAWRVTHHNLLPDWLKDNDFLHYHHRPPLPSFRSCFRSIFRLHTETGNIWTHMIGCIAFLIMMVYFLVTSILSNESWQKIVVYMAFFIGAITCLGFSWLFHTCSCHSDKVAKIFSKLDYSGISLLIVGSFIPWLYFGFYCENISRWFYISLIVVLGAICLMVALKDKFGEPRFRAIRAGLFIALGLSAVIPAIHFLILQGFVEAFTRGSFGWMLFMGSLYIGGALLYAMRIPERFFPGKCDLLVQSHQIFHVMVVAAAFVHYHGLNVMAVYREQIGECMDNFEDDILPYTSQSA